MARATAHVTGRSYGSSLQSIGAMLCNDFVRRFPLVCRAGDEGMMARALRFLPGHHSTDRDGLRCAYFLDLAPHLFLLQPGLAFQSLSLIMSTEFYYTCISAIPFGSIPTCPDSKLIMIIKATISSKKNKKWDRIKVNRGIFHRTSSLLSWCNVS